LSKRAWEYSFEKFQKEALISIQKMIKDDRLVKRSQTLPGSNLARDNQMQIALNNAAEGGWQLCCPPLIIQAFLPMPLKTHINR